ncbi:MAG: hypothetical protein LBB30_04020, partial [Candidatus Methanoplasma sp.]|nr:hypothetical protein [Candidatus Methanoplasma sp.]
MNRSFRVVTALFFAVIFIAPATASVSASEETAPNFVSYYDQLDANGKAIFDAVNSADADTNELNIELPITLTAKMDEGDKAKEFIEKMVKDT